jgi:hypothetical protein
MNQDLEIPPELLVGHWRAVHGGWTLDWVFHGNGTFSGTAARGRKRVSEFTGTWGVQGTSLHSEYTSDTSGMVDVGYADRDVFLEFTVDYFIIQTRGAGKRRYERVQ